MNFLQFVCVFAAGGYFIPAAFFAACVWRVERSSGDGKMIDHLATAILAGLMWPYAPREFIPSEDYDERLGER